MGIMPFLNLNNHRELDTGSFPRDPWKKAMRRSTADAQKGRSRFNSALFPINMEDVEMMESFYHNLCFLISNLRLSDPLSLLLVQEVGCDVIQGLSVLFEVHRRILLICTCNETCY